MGDVEVNAWAIIIAAVAAMIVGSIWYAKGVFGKTWMGLIKLKEEKMNKEAPKSLAKAAIAALVTAYILSHIIAFAVAFYPDRTEVSVGFSTAFFVWLGFYAAQMLMQDAFEQRPFKLTAINAGNSLVTLLAMSYAIVQITY